GVARARNVGDARLRGVEASASARLARTVTLSANYTFLDAIQVSAQPSYDGKQLPQRPRHEAYARVDVARRLAGRVAIAWADLTWIAGSFLDQAELARVPARRLVGAGVKADVVAGVTASVAVENLLDARVEHVALDPAPRPDLSEVPRAVADVAGFPLPGRAVYVAVEWRR
ncbi:MAG: TonB-dependent receptor, partial [Myxococcales bacterium]|nr:TonB-dependent receptor [Myxococcales bacterium]